MPVITRRGQSAHFPPSHFGSDIEIDSQVLKVDALRTFLAAFNADQRNGNIAGRDFRNKFDGRQMTEIVSANAFNRNDGLPFILGQEQERSVHRNLLYPAKRRFVLVKARSDAMKRSIITGISLAGSLMVWPVSFAKASA
jgi:hypothetical protein